MAEIQVERRSSSSAKGWAIILLVLVALLGAGWFYTMGPGATTNPDLPPGVAPAEAPAVPAPTTEPPGTTAPPRP